MPNARGPQWRGSRFDHRGPTIATRNPARPTARSRQPLTGPASSPTGRGSPPGVTCRPALAEPPGPRRASPALPAPPDPASPPLASASRPGVPTGPDLAPRRHAAGPAAPGAPSPEFGAAPPAFRSTWDPWHAITLIQGLPRLQSAQLQARRALQRERRPYFPEIVSPKPRRTGRILFTGRAETAPAPFDEVFRSLNEPTRP